MTEENNSDPEIFSIGIGRTIALMAVFAVMLPFFISMPIMTVMRAAHGNYIDAATIGIAAVIFAVCLYYLALQIRAAQRTKIELTDTGANISTPNWRGMFPTGPYYVKEIPYSEISAVEERGELFRLMGVVGIPRVSSIITKSGERYVLGAHNEGDADPAIDYAKVAQKIADRAGIPVTNKGVIDAGTQAGVLFRGSPSWDKEAISDGRIQVIRRSTQVARHGLVAAFIALAVIGSLIILIPEAKNYVVDLFSGLGGTSSPADGN